MNNKTYISPPEQEDDPFLRDAQEGWTQFPGARSRWWKKKLQFNLFLFGKSWSVLPAAGKLAIGTLSSVALITVAAVTIPFNFSSNKQELAQQETTSQKDKIIPSEEIITNENVSQEETKTEGFTTITNEEQNSNHTIIQNNIPVAEDETEQATVYDWRDYDMETDKISETEKYTESNARMHPVQAKKVNNEISGGLKNALPYGYISQYRYLDYDALNNDIPQAPTSVTTGSLDTKFSNHLEKEKVEASVVLDTIPYKTFVQDAVTKIKDGKYAAAEYQFKKLLVQRPTDENAIFYLGYCFFQQGNYPLALSYFEKTKKTKYMAFMSEADWYTAHIYMLTGERTKAKNLLRKIERSEGEFTEEAQELLQKEFND